MASFKNVHRIILGFGLAGAIWSVLVYTGSAQVVLAATTRLPRSVDLAIPFTSQAPRANWAQPYQDACEEASVLMAHAFYKKETLTAESADEQILQIIEWEKSRFGDYKHTTAHETASIFKEYYNYENVRIIMNPTADAIKKELAAGHPVIVPAAGRLLGNKYFRAPGPLYHMLVVRGYDWRGNFITNDPGTRRGNGFKYKEKILMNAIHDWHDTDIKQGNKVVIVVDP